MAGVSGDPWDPDFPGEGWAARGGFGTKTPDVGE